MTVEVSSIGRLGGDPGSGALDVTGYLIANDLIAVEVWDLGATLVALAVPDGSGGRVDTVLRHPDVAHYADPDDRRGYLGATIGRYANRIAGSRFVLDGRSYSLTANEGPNHLHGGRVGFDQRVWVATIGDEEVTFSLVSDDGDQGYPGRLTASVRYGLLGPTLEIEYRATTDAPTVVNLTNHAYWNLAGGGSIADQEIVVAADRWLPVDDASIPIDGPTAVDRTRFDFRQPTRLDDTLALGGVDQCLLVDGQGFRDVATLTHPPTGRSMVVATDQPAIQLYTANHLDTPYTAVCLETQRAPDAPNQPELGPSVLRPGETYRHRTIHTFAGPGLP